MRHHLDPDKPRYLQNIAEVLEPETSSFKGKIPEWLTGTLISSSPGLFDLKNGSLQNWFDGYAILSKFEIKNSTVTFSSKYLQSSSYKKAIEAQQPVHPEFGTPARPRPRGFLGKILPFGLSETTDNCLGPILKLGTNFITTGDAAFMHEFCAKGLETVATYSIPKVYGMNYTCPQPLEDENGDVYIVGGLIQPTFRYHVLKMSAKDKNNKMDKRFRSICSFPSRWLFGACPSRSFGMTQNFIIFIEMPIVINIMKIAATHIKGYKCLDWVDWRPQDGVRFYVIDKRSGEVMKTEIYSKEPFASPTVVNAYEDADEIILDLVAMPDLECNEATSLSHMRSLCSHSLNCPAVANANFSESCKSTEEVNGMNGSIFSQEQFDNAGEKEEPRKVYVSGTLHRYVIPLIQDIKQHPEEQSLLKSKPKHYSTLEALRIRDRLVLTPEIMTNPTRGGFDFPIINPNYRAKRHTFMYSAAGYIAHASSIYGYAITKLNVRTKGVTFWRGECGIVLSEPVFIPNPNNTHRSMRSSSNSFESGISISSCNSSNGLQNNVTSDNNQLLSKSLVENSQEDDGILVTICRIERDLEKNHFLLFLDAKTMKEIARVEFKSEIAGWFHATFFPSLETL